MCAQSQDKIIFQSIIASCSYTMIAVSYMQYMNITVLCSLCSDAVLRFIASRSGIYYVVHSFTLAKQKAIAINCGTSTINVKYYFSRIKGANSKLRCMPMYFRLSLTGLVYNVFHITLTRV